MAHNKANDLRGERFGKLTALSQTRVDAHRNAIWLCRCDCGRFCEKRAAYLRYAKRIQSCGVCPVGDTPRPRAANRIEMAGKTFGRLTVLYHSDYDSDGVARWLCKCQCGNYAVVRGTSLRRGSTRSCGCLRADNNRARAAAPAEEAEETTQRIPA